MLIAKNELYNAEITGGQILDRLKPEKNPQSEIRECLVLSPKTINSAGLIDIETLKDSRVNIAIDALPKQHRDASKIAVKGDIVLKLCTPYDAALITEEVIDAIKDDPAALNTQEGIGCLVPSFCCKIKVPYDIDSRFFLAFLNSDYCKSQFKAMTEDRAIALLSINKIKSLEMPPLPSLDKQEQIGLQYTANQKKLQLMEEIKELIIKRNDILFRELRK